MPRARAVLASLLLLAACSDAASQQRSFAVGVTTRDFTDLSRATPANGTAAAHAGRSLRTELWYPSTLAVSPSTPDETVDAPPAHGPLPLVVFVHGSEGNRRQSTFLVQALAKDGWLVAAADFPLTASTTPGGPSDLHADDQVGDAKFLADTIFALASGDALAGLADARSGYAIVGHSTGGTVALLAAQAPDVHDDRVRAAAVLSGDSCFLGDAVFSTRRIPLLVVDATRDLIVPAPTNGGRTFALAGQPKTHATLVGGTHLFFTDLALPDTISSGPTTLRDPLAQTLARYGGGTACEPVPPPSADPLLTPDEQHLLTAQVVAGFLDEVFRNERLPDPQDPRLVLARE